MKTRFALILCCWLTMTCPMVGPAECCAEIVESLQTGSINWTQSVLVAKGKFEPPYDPKPAQQDEQATQSAHQQAIFNIIQALPKIRMDSRRHVADLMAANEMMSYKVTEMAQASSIVQENKAADGSVEVTVQMPLLGGFAQMMLPDDIKQVESVKPVNGTGKANAVDQTVYGSQADPGAYTGLIVDARGIGAQPAMVPILVDETGKEVYSPAYVSREYAVQKGVSGYSRSLEALSNSKRVAPKPLMVKGLRTLKNRSSDIVISNIDAAKLRDTSANLDFLKQCRVIIVID